MGTIQIQEVLVEAELLLLFSILANWDSKALNLLTKCPWYCINGIEQYG